MTDFERNIRQNRHLLDEVEEPRTEVIWNRIVPRISGEQENTGQPSPWQFQIGKYWQYGIAASIILVLGIYLMFPPASDPAPAYELTDFYPELEEEVQIYKMAIAQKEKQINIDRIDRETYQHVFQELELLETIHREYAQDLPHYYDNDQLIRTLIRYYEQKIRILERLSKEIDKNKHNEELNRNKRL